LFLLDVIAVVATPSSLCLLVIALPVIPVVVERQGVHGKHVADTRASALTGKEFSRAARALSDVGGRYFRGKAPDRRCYSDWFRTFNQY
jgi:hypothetical protein